MNTLRATFLQAGLLQAGFFALSLLVAPLPASAHHHHSTAFVPSAAGDFDFFLLTLSVAPDFCASSPRNAQKAECQGLTRAAFLATPLTVHGLWPNRANASVNEQPHDCDGAPLGAFPAELAGRLARYMPAGEGLQEYEWRKHGMCSGLDQQRYFGAIAGLAEQMNAVLGPVVRSHAGGVVTVAEVLKAAAGTKGLAGAVVVDCHAPRGGGPALVGEIRVVLSKSLQPQSAASVGMGQNSGCPAGAGQVDEPDR